MQTDTERQTPPAETMTAKKVLTKILNDLSPEDLEKLKSLIKQEKDFPYHSRGRLEAANKADIVELLVETNSPEYMELTKRVLKKMKRTDLEQRYSDISVGRKVKQWPPLIQRVEAMVSVIELLLETLKDLTDLELNEFNGVLQHEYYFHSGYSDIRRKLQEVTDSDETVFVLVQTYGKHSVALCRNTLRKMNRIDLEQKLSDSNTGPKKKQSLDEHLSTLIHKVATMEAVKELLSQALKDLSDEELKTFQLLLQFMFFQRSLPLITEGLLVESEVDELVDLMVKKCGQQSVEITKEVLMHLNRTDLVQRLPDTSSGHEEEHSVDEHCPALIQKVDMMVSIIELLWETLAALSDKEFGEFKGVLHQTDFTEVVALESLMLLEVMQRQHAVFLLVLTDGHKSVKKTKKVLKKMKKNNLVQRLSDRSSAPKEKHSDENLPKVVMGVAKIAAVKQLLLETLKDLSDKELEKFLWIMDETVFKKNRLRISAMRFAKPRKELVDLMVQICGQQSVNLTREVVKKMNRIHLMQKLSDPSSGLKEKHSADEHRPAVLKSTSVKWVLLETLKDFTPKEFQKFKFFLQFTYFQKWPKCILWTQLERADSVDTLVALMVENQQPMEVTKEVFMDMNRPDLVERLSEINSGLKEKQWPPFIQRVEAMASVIELLVETLEDLTYFELKEFNGVLQHEYYFHRRYSDIRQKLQEVTDSDETVFLMVQTYGKHSVALCRNALRKMNRIDLEQKLSDSNTGPKKKQSLDEHLSTLIHKVATVAAVKELLSQALNDLTDEELKTFQWLLQFMFFQRSLPLITKRLLVESEVDELVDLMVKKCGQQSVEMTKEVLMHMNRTDLVQRLPDTSSGHEEEHSVDEHCPALIQKVDMMVSIIELLWETLAALSDKEFEEFKWVLHQTDFTEGVALESLMLLEVIQRQHAVFLLVQTDGHQSVETTKKVLYGMKRTDLVQRLSDGSSAPKERHSKEHLPALIKGVATWAAVKQLLLKTLKDLSDDEFSKFLPILVETVSQKKLLVSLSSFRPQCVKLMMQTYGQQSFDITREVVEKMNRSDLMQRLSDPSSGLKEKHQSTLLDKELTTTSMMEMLLETLQDLNDGEFEQFKWLLQHTERGKDLPRTPTDQMEKAERGEIAALMVEAYGQQCVEVTKEVLMKMNSKDLVQRFSEIILGAEGPSGSLELEGCSSSMQVSSDWTKLEPKVSSTDESPTYSLKSDAGNFECSVSGLRWVSHDEVSFSYQFCSLKDHMQRIESMQYMPAGPLIHITVISGKIDVVYLPHWICIDDPTLLDKFAVMHIDDCGVTVEKVSEVTLSHLKLCEPEFSGIMGLLEWLGISPVEIYCKVVIYSKTDTPSLTLHVYLIPPDPALIEEIDRLESSDRYKRIRKGHPKMPLKMNGLFMLKGQLDEEETAAEALRLRHDSIDPDFAEMYIENHNDRDVDLKLTEEKREQPVWTCVIRKGEYQSNSHIEEEHPVEEDMSAQMQETETMKRLLEILRLLTNEQFHVFKWHLASPPDIYESELQNMERPDVVSKIWQTYTQSSVKMTKTALKDLGRNDLVLMLSEPSSHSKAAG